MTRSLGGSNSIAERKAPRKRRVCSGPDEMPAGSRGDRGPGPGQPAPGNASTNWPPSAQRPGRVSSSARPWPPHAAWRALIVPRPARVTMAIRSIATMRLRIYAAGEVDSVAKIMISLPDGFLRRVDRTAKAQGRSRSELIREALRGMLADQETVSGSWKDALAPLRELEEQWVGRWDSTDIIRYYRETRYGRQDRR